MRFGEKATQEQVAKIAKTHNNSTLFKSPVPKPLTIDSPDCRQPRRAHVAPQHQTSSLPISHRV
jgi:hypothetical protein